MNGNDACGCCAGIGAATPQALDNRKGLSAVAYRVGDHAQFRDSMVAALSLSRFGAVARLTTRAPDDFTIGLIDAFACAADVLTFYQERIANESWLRTATERISLQELGKLVGYRLRPGIAAETWLAFALETPPAPPPNLPPEPGNFVTGIPERVMLDAGLKVQSVPGPDETPQTFETVERIDARPEWNAMRPWLSASMRPAAGDTSAWVAGPVDRPRPGDGALILGDRFLANADDTNWDFRVIDGVDYDAATQRTRLAWAKGLTGMTASGAAATGDAQIHLFRKRAAVFGHNAPKWDGLATDFQLRYARLTTLEGLAGHWPRFNGSPDAPDETGGDLDLDAVYPDVRNDGYVVLRTSSVRRLGRAAHAPEDGLYRVDGVDEISRAEFGLSGKVTRLRLLGEGLARFWGSVRETSVYLQSVHVRVADYPVDTAIEGAHVPVSIAGAGLHAGRRLIVRGTLARDGSALVHAATLVAVHAFGGSRCDLEIAPPLPGPLLRASVVVHANVVRASHGESVTQILGSGDAGAVFQSFELKHAPLTWLAAGNELGATSALSVRVGDVQWSERGTLYGATPVERAFVLATDAQGKDHVVFGDGVRGARLPTGPNNVVATYRKGLGIDGNVGADRLTQLVSRPLGLKSVSNLLPAEGGTDPEPADAARDTLPLATRTLGRVVSVLDYEDFARAFSGVAKAQARVLQPLARTTVAVTIAGEGGVVLTPSNPVWTHLADALRDRGDPHVAVQLLPYTPGTFRLGIRVKCDPAYAAKAVLADVEAALRARFSFRARALGQPVQQSEVIAAVHAVPGVVAADITRFHGGSWPPAQMAPSTQLRLLASQMRVEGGVLAPAELLTLDPAPLFQLEAMA